MPGEHVAEAEARGRVARIASDGRLKAPGGFRQVVDLERCLAEFVLQEREHLVVLRRVGAPLAAERERRELLPSRICLLPLVLVLVELLQVRERVAVLGIELEHFVERFDGAIDEAAAAIVEGEAEEDVRVLQPAQLGPLEQILMRLDRTADLSLLAIQVAEDQVDLQRIARRFRRLGQLFDRLVDLAGDEKVEAQHVVRRLAGAAPIDPDAVVQLVALPRLADGQPGEQGNEPDQQRGGGGHLFQELGDGRAPMALRAQHVLDALTHGAAPAAAGADPVNGRADFRRGVRGRGREPRAP